MATVDRVQYRVQIGIVRVTPLMVVRPSEPVVPSSKRRSIMKHLPTRGILVVFEGIDGAGKTTQAAMVADRLSRCGLEVVSSKEPTTGPWGRMLRESAQTGRLDPEGELQAFINDRSEHVANLINPALETGKIVLLDRYYFSTAAYQGIRTDFSVQEIIDQNEEFAPEPDVLVILDVDPTVGIQRIHERGDRANLFEKQADLEASREIFRSFGQRPYSLMLNANRAPDDLADRIVTEIERRMADRIALAPMSPEERIEVVSGLLRPAE